MSEQKLRQRERISFAVSVERRFVFGIGWHSSKQGDYPFILHLYAGPFKAFIRIHRRAEGA